MVNLVHVCHADDIPLGGSKIVLAGKHSVGVFRLKDGYFALLNVCPHKGGALCRGPVTGTAKTVDDSQFVYEKDGELIRCAWHGWEFDIRSGQCLIDTKMRAKRFSVVVKDEQIYLQM